MRSRDDVAAGHSRDPRRLGHRSAGSGQRDRARRHTRVRRPHLVVPDDAARSVRWRRRPARRPDGELGGRSPHDRVRADPAPGSRAGDTRGRKRRVLGDPGAHGGVRQGAAARWPGAPARARLDRRGPFPHRPPARPALTRRGQGDGRSARGCMRSPTVATCHHMPPPPIWRRSRPSGWRRSSAATTRWTATDAGSAPIARSPRSATASASRPTTRSPRSRRATHRGITDEFVEPVVLAGRPRLDPSTGRGGGVQLPARSRPAARVPPARARCRPDDHDAVRGRSRLPRRLRRAGRARHAGRDARAGRGPTAARRGDREVRARDVLLQRWRGDGVAGRDAHPRAVATRRAELRPEAGHVRPRGRPIGSRARSATATALR